jgi:hypothetical protein
VYNAVRSHQVNSYNVSLVNHNACVAYRNGEGCTIDVGT